MKNWQIILQGSFDNKIKQILSETSIDYGIFNGNRKLHCDSVFFMDINSVRDCMEFLITKSSEGHDRIPQRIIKDGGAILIEPFSELFRRIYFKRNIPGQLQNDPCVQE
jgi:hypothetical protein